jgi:hypothetical protein
MQNKIDIGTTIDLQDLLQSRLLIQGNSGAGKSVLARVIIEQTFGIVPFIVLDIEGEYYTLKEKFGDILVIGGQHADIPINMQSGKLLPKEIIGNRLSVVIDLSDLQMNDRILYAKYFLETMMELPKEYWINYLVFIEEAHTLCGEQDKQASARAVKDLMSRGRKRGYCGILLTQRISKLHKDAAAECNNKFIGKTFLDLDMDRSAKELGFTASSEYNRLSLRELEKGNFFAFGTSIEPHQVHIVTINHPQTKIPKAGVNLDIKPKAPTEKIKAMLGKLNEIETQKPKSVSKLQKSDTNVQESEIKLLKTEINFIKQKLFEANKQLEAKDKQITHFVSIIEEAGKVLGKPVPKFDLSVTYTAPAPYVKNNSIAKVVHKTEPKVVKNYVANGTVSGGAMRMLKAAAMYPSGITKTRMAALARLSYTSGSFGTYLSTLKKGGYITGEGNNFCITEYGLQEAGDVELLPTDPLQLIEMWCDILGNQSGVARMLRVLGKKYPQALSKEALGDLVEMSSTSGSFGTYLSTLKRNGLISISSGQVKAADELFN